MNIMNIRDIFNKIKQEVIKYNPPVLRKNNILDNDFKKFVAIFLSPRTKDEVLIKVCEKLFKHVKSFKDVLEIDTKILERIIKPVGMYRIKAKNLKLASKKILEEYNGNIPSSYEELIKINGIGKKVAKVILSEIYNKSYVAVDTHVHRISNRIGIISTKNVDETDRVLDKILPEDIKKEYNRIMVAFGQTICLPKKPKCNICPIKIYCKHFLYFRQNNI